MKPSTQVQKAGGWLTRQTKKLSGRHIKVSIGALGAVSLSLVFLAIAQSPERPTEQSAAAGQRLFETILGQHLSIRQESRIQPTSDRGPATNRMVLPDVVWDEMSTEDRNSLGLWLNSIGDRWEIRKGPLADDSNRLNSSEAVMTSRQWNQQTR